MNRKQLEAIRKSFKESADYHSNLVQVTKELVSPRQLQMHDILSRLFHGLSQATEKAIEVTEE